MAAYAVSEQERMILKAVKDGPDLFVDEGLSLNCPRYIYLKDFRKIYIKIYFGGNAFWYLSLKENGYTFFEQRISFERVLELVPDEIKTKLLFHFDLDF